MLLHKTPKLIQLLYPGLTWRKPTNEKIIYITFDDGPIPELTEYTLEVLSEFNARATYFCVGDNLVKNISIAEKVVRGNHSIGNHTQNHLNGWKTETSVYVQNVERCQQEIKELVNTNLFRPPYGKISRQQIGLLKGEYNIIMWDVLSGDFSQDLSVEKCLQKSIQHTKNGSIIIFHDNYKAEKNLKYTLPRYLDHFSNLGFSFQAL